MALTDKLTAIADRIRSITGKSEKLNLDEMSQGIMDVFAAGMKNEKDIFWAKYQNYGNRTNYSYAFAGEGWTPDVFAPCYDIVPTDATSMFESSQVRKNISQVGVKIDFSKATHLNYVFRDSYFTELGVLDFSNADYLTGVFQLCTGLKTVEKLILSSTKLQGLSNAFNYCSSLENITIEGYIRYNGVSFASSSKLTHDSLMSIITALYDYSGTGETYKIILGSTNLGKLTDEEKEQIARKGWTVS